MNHFLALPMFFMFRYSISESISDYNGRPEMWIYLLLNILTQYVCVSGVHRLSANASSLTLNLVLSLRKVLSLFLSVILFNNPFTSNHVIGALLVTFGTFFYTHKPKIQSESKKDN